jgi:hypothetical protein
MKHIVSFTIILLLTTVSCTPFISPTEEDMQTMSLKLVSLTKMVEAGIRYENMNLERGERPLLICATAEDEKLFHWLDDSYYIRADIKAGHAVVLVCTKDGKKGLYEDTNCVEGPDVDLRKYDNKCEFTLTESFIKKNCD